MKGNIPFTIWLALVAASVLGGFTNFYNLGDFWYIVGAGIFVFGGILLIFGQASDRPVPEPRKPSPWWVPAVIALVLICCVLTSIVTPLGGTVANLGKPLIRVYVTSFTGPESQWPEIVSKACYAEGRLNWSVCVLAIEQARENPNAMPKQYTPAEEYDNVLILAGVMLFVVIVAAFVISR